MRDVAIFGAFAGVVLGTVVLIFFGKMLNPIAAIAIVYATSVAGTTVGCFMERFVERKLNDMAIEQVAMCIEMSARSMVSPAQAA